MERLTEIVFERLSEREVELLLLVEATSDSDCDSLLERLKEAESLIEPWAECDNELLIDELLDSSKERELEVESLTESLLDPEGRESE